MRYLLTVVICLATIACDRFDSSKIIEPTDYQIQSVSFSLKDSVVPTNMAAQQMDDDQNFTLVGANLRKGNREFIGLWLFNNEDSTDIRSINQNAQDFSIFPQLRAARVKDEADNLIAFLDR